MVIGSWVGDSKDDQFCLAVLRSLCLPLSIRVTELELPLRINLVHSIGVQEGRVPKPNTAHLLMEL